jgi:antitoxin HigA-1
MLHDCWGDFWINDQWRVCLPLRSSEVAKKSRADAPLEIVAEHPPVHPGTVLQQEFMRELGLTAYAIAKACKMPRSKLERIVRGELGISGDTAVRLGRYFGISDRFWMNLQSTYEVMKARQAIGKSLDAIEPLRRDAA